MDFKMKVIGNHASIQQKAEQGTDGKVKQIDVTTSRIALRGDDVTLQFATDYETGKKYELGREITVSIPD